MGAHPEVAVIEMVECEVEQQRPLVCSDPEILLLVRAGGFAEISSVQATTITDQEGAGVGVGHHAADRCIAHASASPVGWPRTCT